jgi:ABC-type nitrate/sulfonate/bicarbonate transport system substrate-binding protein
MGSPRLNLILVPVLVVFLTVGFNISAWGQKGDNVIRIGYNRVWTAPALIVAKAKGWFNRPGLEVKWVNFMKPPQAIEAIAAGSLDATVALDPIYLIARERGVKISAVAQMSGVGVPASTYWTVKGSGINKVEDLKGKSCGVNNYGGNFDLFLRHHLITHGLKPMVDVKIYEVAIPVVIKSLLAKKIDCGVLPSLFSRMVQLKFSDKLQPIFSYHDLDINKDGWNTMILVMSNELLTKKRPAAKRFMEVYLKAVKFVHDNPADTLKVWSEEVKIGLITQMEKPPLMSPDGKLNMKAMQNTIMLLKRYKFTKTEPKAEDVVDHSLIDEILAGR